MKILVYSLGLPPFRRGGLVKYSVDLSEQLSENGNEVTFLYPGHMPFLNSRKCRFKRRKTHYKFDCFELINPLPVSLTFGNSINAAAFYADRSKYEMERFISQIAPDVVHLHTIMGLPIQFLEVLKEKNIKIVFTTHDYYGLCPKMLTDNPLEKLQSSECTYDCMMCNAGPSIDTIKIMQSHLYQTFKNSQIFKYLRSRQRDHFKGKEEKYSFNRKQAIERYKLRKYYLNLFSKINYIHFNSSVAEQVFKQYLPNVKGKVVPLVINGLKQKANPKVANDRTTIGFLGGVERKKGFALLSKVLCELKADGMQFDVICAGSNANDKFFDKDYVTNLGIISRNQVDDFYNHIDVLVVPSLWHETFGLVVVEAMANNVPVICSDMVGAKDLIPSDYVFHSKKDLVIRLKEFISSSTLRDQAFSKFSNLNYDMDFKKHVSLISREFYY